MDYIPGGIATNSDVMVGGNATVNEEECFADGTDIHLCLDGAQHQRLYISIDVGVLKRLMVVADRLILECEAKHSTPQPIQLPE